MKKSELKSIIRECIEEVYIEEGVRSGYHKLAAKAHRKIGQYRTNQGYDATDAGKGDESDKRRKQAYNHSTSARYHDNRAKRYGPKPKSIKSDLGVKMTNSGPNKRFGR